MASHARILGVCVLVTLGCGSVGCGSGDAAPPAQSEPFIASAPASSDVLLERDGALEPTDQRGAVSFVDRLDVPVAAGEHVRITVTSSAFDTVLEVTPPRGAPLTNDDHDGDRTRSQIELATPVAGALKVQVTSFQPGAQGAYHVRVERVRAPVPPTPAIVAAAAPAARRHHVLGDLLSSLGASGTAGSPQPATLRVGDRASAALAEGDHRLESGELADVYVLDVAAATDLTIQMQSTSVDSYLLIAGPGDRTWENDDSGGALDASITIPAAAPGQYRVVATSYRPGAVGLYELKVLTARDAAPSTTAVAAGESTQGELAAGDRQLPTGELSDEHLFTWPVGTAVHLEARSTDFDTYLILRTPSGEQRDNDDRVAGVLDAGMDFVVHEAGEHHVLVTSYRPGETGRYELVVAAGGAAPSSAVVPSTVSTAVPAIAAPRAGQNRGATATGATSAAPRTVRGALAAGDTALQSGELSDAHTATFTAGARVRIRVESSAFDTYLIVRSPSGRQQDNDDVSPGVLHSEVEIPAAEAGEYRILVTSYRPGETGAYTLTITDGASSQPSVPTRPGAPVVAPGESGSRVWLLSVGISDYPGGGNDLPECANDATKIAEALRNQGLTAPEREILLTDSQATIGAIRSAMQRIATQMRPDDTFVFFYSGHGGQSTTRSNDVRELDGLDEYLFVYDGELLDDEFGRLTDAIHARTSLIAIDSCFAGGFSKDVITRPGVVGMFSSEEDVTSAVAGQFQAGGYLSHFLRLGIQGEADDDPRDRVMTVGELTHFVWLQYGRHASAVRMQMGYQHLVVDRGAVHTTQELWRSNG